MKYLMDDKGNKYLPENSLFSIETIKEVLQSNKHISEYDFDNLVKTFQSLGKTEIKKSEKSEKPKTKSSKILDKNNINYIDSLGFIHYKRGRHRKSSWNFRQVISIQTKLDNDYSYVTKDQKEQLAHELGLKYHDIRTIIINLKNGWLGDMVEKWKIENNYGIKHKPTQVVNNPERRKEMGFGGIP